METESNHVLRLSVFSEPFGLHDQLGIHAAFKQCVGEQLHGAAPHLAFSLCRSLAHLQRGSLSFRPFLRSSVPLPSSHTCPFHPQGKPVNTLLVAKKMSLTDEKYFAIALDRKTAGPIVIACRCAARGLQSTFAGSERERAQA